jgi:hypothetical protein
LKAISFFFASPCTLRDLSDAMPSLCVDMTSSQPMESTRHGPSSSAGYVGSSAAALPPISKTGKISPSIYYLPYFI